MAAFIPFLSVPFLYPLQLSPRRRPRWWLIHGGPTKFWLIRALRLRQLDAGLLISVVITLIRVVCGTSMVRLLLVWRCIRSSRLIPALAAIISLLITAVVHWPLVSRRPTGNPSGSPIRC